MFGSGDRILGVAGWGFLLIPLVLLWVLSWGIGLSNRLNAYRTRWYPSERAHYVLNGFTN